MMKLWIYTKYTEYIVIKKTRTLYLLICYGTTNETLRTHLKLSFVFPCFCWLDVKVSNLPVPISRENAEHLASCRSRGWGSSRLSAARRSSIWLTSKMEGPRGQTAAKTRRIMDRMLFSSISVRSAFHLVGSDRREFDMNPRRRKRRK